MCQLVNVVYVNLDSSEISAKVKIAKKLSLMVAMVTIVMSRLDVSQDIPKQIC